MEAHWPGEVREAAPGRGDCLRSEGRVTSQGPEEGVWAGAKVPWKEGDTERKGAGRGARGDQRNSGQTCRASPERCAEDLDIWKESDK